MSIKISILTIGKFVYISPKETRVNFHVSQMKIQILISTKQLIQHLFKPQRLHTQDFSFPTVPDHCFWAKLLPADCNRDKWKVPINPKCNFIYPTLAQSKLLISPKILCWPVPLT